MEFQEIARMILGLRAYGFTEKAITNLILWVATGDEQYRDALRQEKKP